MTSHVHKKPISLFPSFENLEFGLFRAGPDAPTIFNCVIEIPRGSKVKYELDKKTGLIMVKNCCSFFPHVESLFSSVLMVFVWLYAFFAGGPCALFAFKRTVQPSPVLRPYLRTAVYESSILGAAG